MTRSLIGALGFGLAALLAAAPLRAQAVNGSVADSATLRPLEGVTAELLDPVGRVVAAVAADDSGRFVVTAPDSGTFHLQVRRIGYRTALSGGIALDRDALVTVEVHLPALAVTLAPVKVETSRNEFLTGRGYYQRKESERGAFLDPDVVEKKATKAKLATDILIGIPGVSIYQNAPKLRGCRTLLPNGDTPGGARIYIDGVEGGTEMMWSLQPNDILAVEVYIGPSQIPLQYGGTNTPCGIILIWIKH